jgi:hypothetical protein
MKLRFLVLALFVVSTLAPAQSTPQRHFGPELTFTPEKHDNWPDERIRPVALPDGRLLLSRFGTVYMLDASGKQLWKYVIDGETLTSEPAYNAETNEIGVVGYDLLFVRLDAATGEEKWRAKTVGGGVFISVAAYGRGFLVVVDMTAYREKAKEFDPHMKGTDPDRLEYWGQTEDDGWIADFPIGAQLLVNGKYIYCVRRTRDVVHLRELQPTSGQKR